MAKGKAINGSGTGPFQRADGRWMVQATVGYDAGTGKPIRKTMYGKTASEAAAKLRAVTAAVDSKTYQEPQRMKLSQWLDIWLAEYCGGIKSATLKSYSDIVKCHIKPKLGAVRLSDLQPHHVQRFINDLERDSKPKPLSNKTIKNIHGVLSKALSEAVRVKYIASNPAAGTVLPKKDTAEMNPLDAEEIVRFCEAIKGNPYEPVFYVALNTGMRLSEILGLRWSRVDFKKGTITVDVQLLCQRGKDYKRTLGSPKNGKSRTFKPAPAVMECLKAVSLEQKEWQIKAGEVWSNPLDLCFTNTIGGELVHITIERHFNRVIEAADIPAHRFHDLRHTYCVEAIMAGIPAKTISETLGHSSVAFTLNKYAHVTNAMQDEASERMQARILGRK